jgi:hypothetical protein
LDDWRAMFTSSPVFFFDLRKLDHRRFSNRPSLRVYTPQLTLPSRINEPETMMNGCPRVLMLPIDAREPTAPHRLLRYSIHYKQIHLNELCIELGI